MNFLTEVDLTDEQLDTVMSTIQAWCGREHADPEGVSARAAAAIALELISTHPSVTSEELLNLLSNQLSGAGSK
ncbi:MAG: hypothetical protein AAAB20_03790 [Rhizobium sp.]|uniref:hypothetical protein n=1 Tax=Rhizobium sp. TaxID=391 RepID=UPI0030EFB598